MSTVTAELARVPDPAHAPGAGASVPPFDRIGRLAPPARLAPSVRLAPAAPPARVAPTARAAPERAAGAARREPLRLALRLAPLLGLIVSAALVWWGIEAGVLTSLESLRAFITSLGAWGPLAFLVITVALVVFPVIPGGLTVIAAPVLFGAVEGIALAYLAVCTGLLLNFTIGRYVGLGLLERALAPRTVEKYLGWTRRPGFTRAFATVIAVPIAPDDLLCYLAGTTRMRWRTAVVVILLGKPWSLMVYGLGVSAVLLRLLPW